MSNTYGEIVRAAMTVKSVYLYGAGIVAYGISEALWKLAGICITAYIVSERKANESEYAGHAVVAFSELPKDMADALILIAAPEIYHEEIEQIIRHRPDCMYYALGYQLVYEFMRRYYKCSYGLMSLKDITVLPAGYLTDKSCEVYMAKCTSDTPLKEKYTWPPQIIGVQAGAASTDRCVAVWRDDTGDHISGKNRYYSELTVTYWAWKNCQADYKGICHYRRRLELTQVDYQQIAANDIDVVLPYPYLCYGDTSFQYHRYIGQLDMDTLHKILTVDERRDVEEVLGGKYLYNHNILLAREKIFDTYCAWIFPIMQRIEEYYQQKGILREPRYMGYIGELLTAVYFTVRQNMWKIIHAPERWLI